MQKISDDMSVIVFRLDSGLKQRFQQICDGRVMSTILRELIKKYCATKEGEKSK